MAGTRQRERERSKRMIHERNHSEPRSFVEKHGSRETIQGMMRINQDSQLINKSREEKKTETLTSGTEYSNIPLPVSVDFHCEAH